MPEPCTCSLAIDYPQSGRQLWCRQSLESCRGSQESPGPSGPLSLRPGRLPPELASELGLRGWDEANQREKREDSVPVRVGRMCRGWGGGEEEGGEDRGKETGGEHTETGLQISLTTGLCPGKGGSSSWSRSLQGGAERGGGGVLGGVESAGQYHSDFLVSDAVHPSRAV